MHGSNLPEAAGFESPPSRSMAENDGRLPALRRLAMALASATERVPHLDIDPFSVAFLTDPYPDHARMRDAGPVVHLTRYGILAMARHAEVFAALNDWRAYSSARGVGLQDFAKE